MAPPRCAAAARRVEGLRARLSAAEKQLVRCKEEEAKPARALVGTVDTFTKEAARESARRVAAKYSYDGKRNDDGEREGKGTCKYAPPQKCARPSR